MKRAGICLLLLAACHKKPPTEEELFAKEQKDMTSEAGGLKSKAYRTVRSAVPNKDLQVESGRPLTPSEQSMMLTVSFILMMQPKMALYELSTVDENALEPDQRPGLHILRGYVYSRLGWPRLSKREYEAALPPSADSSAQAAEIRKSVHYAMVFIELSQNDTKAAADEVNSARDVFEGDPWGELCIALAETHDGDYVKAADALDRAAATDKFDADEKRQMAQLSSEMREAKDRKTLIFKYLVQRAIGFGRFDAGKAFDRIHAKASELAGKIKP